uniref:Tc1-like transposase DDE domain-containing protein n=1 Tax=Hucho hucho TaxID=62062 RepID=A0A4W5MA59_9TELE
MCNNATAASRRGFFQAHGDGEEESKQPSHSYMLSDFDSDPSSNPGSETDPDSEEAESEPELDTEHKESATTGPEFTELRDIGKGPQTNVYKEEAYISTTHTQPKTKGELHIHSVLEILHDNLLQSAQDLNLGKGSPSNMTTALSTQPRQRRSGFGTSLNVLEWPSQSPDLNPIEHLWRDLKIAVQRRSPSNLTELEMICREEWEKLPKYRCAKL